jgi:hypothetical protein
VSTTYVRRKTQFTNCILINEGSRGYYVHPDFNYGRVSAYYRDDLR